MRRTILRLQFYSVFILIANISFAQTFQLHDIQEKAIQHYPLLKQKELIRSLGQNTQSLLSYNALPQAKITGQATYQSEVTKFDFPGIPSPKPNNFSIGLDLHYGINDFDLLKTHKELDEQRTSLGLKQIDIDLQKLKERITVLFGNILLQKENKDLLNVRVVELETQLKRVSSSVKNGMTLKSNELILEAELLSTQEKLADIEATLKGLTGELSLLTGMEINPGNEFKLPASDGLNEKIERPELEAFKGQQQLLNLQDRQWKQENKPHLALFAQGFYGRPGYNFLRQDARLFGIGGIALNWNINNAATQKTKFKSSSLQQQLLEQQETTFQLNLKAALLQKEEEIRKFNIILAKDQQILTKRKEILQVVSSQLNNGTITSTEYITELNAMNMAELNFIMHKVQEAMAKVQYNIMTGH